MGPLEEAANRFTNASTEIARDDAFRELAKEVQRVVLPEIRIRCWHADDVESVLQETLIKIAKSLGELKDPSRIRAWVLEIAKNTALNSNRTRSRKIKGDFSMEELEDAIQRGLKIQNPPLSPDEIVQVNDLLAVIKRLEKRCQELLSHALEGLTAREISEKTGENPETVAVYLTRCRESARKALKGLEPNG